MPHFTENSLNFSSNIKVKKFNLFQLTYLSNQKFHIHFVFISEVKTKTGICHRERFAES
jgi:hypothetical protein